MNKNSKENVMCDNKIVPKIMAMTKKTSALIREMFNRKAEAPAAFDFVSPPKKTEQADKRKACSAA